jgi:hypothetical protein
MKGKPLLFHSLENDLKPKNDYSNNNLTCSEVESNYLDLMQENYIQLKTLQNTSKKLLAIGNHHPLEIPR